MHRTVNLSGGSPWGFRLVGGCDFRATLAISKVTPGGKADQAGLKAGDVILAINNKDTEKLPHTQAQNEIKSSSSLLTLKIKSPNEQSSPTPPNPTPPPKVNIPVSYPSKSSTFSSPATANSWKPKATQSIRPSPAISKPKPPQPSIVSYPLPPPPVATDPLPPPPTVFDPLPPPPIVYEPLPPPPNANDDYLPPPPPQKNNNFPPAPSHLQKDFPPPPSVKTSEATTEQAGSGEKIICEGCKKPITSGSYLSARGKNWHPEEFICSSPTCGRSLKDIGFIEEKGKRYCSECYAKYHSKICSKCNEIILQEVMHALDQTWHPKCFVCTHCGKTFHDGVFQMEKNKPYCVDDFNKLFGSTCKACGLAIVAGDQYVEAIKAQWHDHCFSCKVCQLDLRNVSFFSVDGMPVCTNHMNARLVA